MAHKWMWIVAGPNGAGKSSFAGELIPTLHKKTLIKLNADDRTAELRKEFPDVVLDKLNLRAAQETDQRVDELIEADKSFVVETVLSSDKYRRRVLRAKERGFRVGLIYVSLYPPELSPQRVGLRVQKGGHNVDHDTAVKRHIKSHEQLRWFAPLADTLIVFDNSREHGDSKLVAHRLDGKPFKYVAPGINPSLDDVLKDMLPKKPPRKAKPSLG